MRAGVFLFFRLTACFAASDRHEQRQGGKRGPHPTAQPMPDPERSKGQAIAISQESRPPPRRISRMKNSGNR